MLDRSRRPILLISMLLGASLCSGLAVAAEKRVDPAAKAASDPRSGAALNRDTAKRKRAAPVMKVAPARIHQLTVNNAAADLTAQDTQSETTISDVGGGNLVAGWNDSGSLGPVLN